MGNNLSQGIPVSDALVMSVVGFAIVFFVLVVLMAVIKILRGALESLDKAKAAPAAAPVAAAAPSPAAPAKDPNMVPAKGSVGEIKLFDVDDKTAALIMAIVADEMQAPLNELRFLSIREKK
ncbi:MAG: OadG family protein [Planctomycetes bacterium]|nr:OadG family protein [Planctomycetota bacterium]MCC8115870.1 OadG family protein [Planctomycetota bacterium]MCD7896012.1 OadG family protein [Planctomycetaceae bacterium]